MRLVGTFSLKYYIHFPLSGNEHFAGVAQLVEHQPSKLRVAGSSLVSRSSFTCAKCFGYVYY